ncbi:MAG TPA: GTP-binding protein [Polyangia bacterium]|jgi:G3E family GTPase/WD40 repeat protein|nr:GTP-binding protein [Polyangia bacterium]
MTPKIPVTVLAGAMGAGKTTLINHIVAESGQRIVVIQNEIGEVTAEGAPVIATDEEIFEMDDGLVCGTVRGDLIRALVGITKRRQQYDRVLIEATGPADPGPIVRTFLMDQEIQRSFRLDGLAFLVDGRLLSLYTDGKTGSHEQIAFANVLIVNKADLVSANEVSAMERWLRSVNGTARVRSTTHAQMPLDQLLNINRHAIDRALGRGTRPSDSRLPALERPSVSRIAAVVGATLPTARAKGWRVDVGEFPRAIAWSTAGGELAVATAAGDVEVRRAGDGHPILRRTVHEGAINAIAWQPGQARMATAGEDGAVRILQVGADEPLVVVRPARRAIDVIAWSPKGDLLAVAKNDAGVLFAPDGKQVRRIPAVDSTITGLTWSPDGAAIACSCWGGVHIIDPNTGGRLRQLQGKGSMLSLAWSPDGAVVASGCQDNNVHFWRFPQASGTVLPGTPLKPRALSWSSDSQLLATTDGPDVMVWNFAGDGMPPPPVRLVGPPSLTTAVAFGPGGLLATGYRDGMVHIWKPREQDQSVGVQPLDGQIESLMWGPAAVDGSLLLAAATAAGSVAVWMIENRAGARTASTAEKARRESGNLPTLYLHKLR